MQLIFYGFITAAAAAEEIKVQKSEDWGVDYSTYCNNFRLWPVNDPPFTNSQWTIAKKLKKQFNNGLIRKC